MTASLYYGNGPTVAGPALIVWSDAGIRVLRLLHGTTLAKELADLGRQERTLILNQVAAQKLLKQVDAVLDGKREASSIALDLEGTPFQRRVWAELLRVPRGSTLTYQALAAKINQPRAVRAVANACGRNPVCLLVPCHRIIRSDGGLGGYYYGLQHKRALLQHEGAV